MALKAKVRKADGLSPQDQLVGHVRKRAENLYLTRQLLCTEAVLVALNEGLGGGLTEEQAVGLSAGLTIGLGESGCLCGALSGGVLALGLFLGDGGPHRHRKEIRSMSRELHDRFKEKFQSTCCRVLTKRVRGDSKAHFEQCARLTGAAAEMAVRVILEKRPELAESNGRPSVVERNETRACGRLRWLLNFLCR